MRGRAGLQRGPCLVGSTHPVHRTERQVATTNDVKRSAYVTQDDVHLPTLTVRETLHYAALLRMEEEVG